MNRTFRITDEGNRRYGDCYVVRERKRTPHGFIYEWVVWCRTLIEAEKFALGLGVLADDSLTSADRRDEPTEN